jgi:hypothetical protein
MEAYCFPYVTTATLPGNNIELQTADRQYTVAWKSMLSVLSFIQFSVLGYLKHAHFHAKSSVKCFGLVDLKRNENGEICYNNSYCV